MKIERGHIFNHRDGQKELDMFDRHLYEERIAELRTEIRRLKVVLSVIARGSTEKEPGMSIQSRPFSRSELQNAAMEALGACE